jgi:1-acyl-sn-glycerol-3-phosphate acyltransferase
MIVARKTWLATPCIGAYVGWKVRAAFRGVWLRGTLPEGPAPLVVYANHGSFWDGFVAHQLCRAGGWDGYCMMEERMLARYPFLAALGAFSIRRLDPRATLETFRYARRLLAAPRRAVFVFPEGELRPVPTLPLHLERGVEVLARLAAARCVPLAIRYVFLEDERPDVLLAIGEAHPAAPLREMNTRLGALLESLLEARDTAGFQRLVRGRRSVAGRWDAVRGMGAAA